MGTITIDYRGSQLHSNASASFFFFSNLGEVEMVIIGCEKARDCHQHELGRDDGETGAKCLEDFHKRGSWIQCYVLQRNTT